MATYHVGVDVGGTFTDVLAFNEEDESIIVAKSSSTPSQPEIGVMNGIEMTGISGRDIRMFLHGTTVGTNALIERKLPKTALITTKGFRDVPEIRRGTKLDLWDAYADVAPPYIRRRDRFEVDERTDYSGNILKAVDEDEVRRLARKLKKRGVESVAICFINAYVNGTNEKKSEANIGGRTAGGLHLRIE